MNRPLLRPLCFALAYFCGAILIVYVSPRFDWVTIAWFFLLAMVLGLLHYLSHRRDEAKLRDAVKRLSDLLHSFAEQTESLPEQAGSPPLEDGIFGVLHDEIYKSLVSQKRSRDAALKAKEQLKRNMEDVTHQIKTPLTGVLLLLELWESDPHHAVEYQGRIRQEIERLCALSDLLLKLSSMDAGAIAFEESSFAAHGLVIDVEFGLDAIINQKNIYLEVVGEDFMILGDRAWLMEALINIVRNAVAASPAGGKIEISLSRNAIFQSITVKDAGPGLTPEQQKRVFERFYKGDPQSPGFGIGLSLAKAIVRQHGGELLLRSSSGGSEFEMRFYPRMKKEEELVSCNKLP